MGIIIQFHEYWMSLYTSLYSSFILILQKSKINDPLL